MALQVHTHSRLPPQVVRGRFAPSPTGALHLGSLVAAVGSYMIAKQAKGEWFVRIEDLDPPREVAGSATQILQTLDDFGLRWDSEVIYQSQRLVKYQQVLEELKQQRIVYQCNCSRKMVEQRNAGIYDGYCRNKSVTSEFNSATRIKFREGFGSFEDNILGICRFDKPKDRQDFIIKRRDGLFAYQLAVVVDDIEQGVNQVVRGSDILDSTPRQNFLYHCLNNQRPDYYHLPLVRDDMGIKYSKRFGAKRIDKQIATQLLIKALQHLGQTIETGMQDATPIELIDYYTKHWQIKSINAVSNEAEIMEGI